MTYMEYEMSGRHRPAANGCWRFRRKIGSGKLIAVMLDENEFLSPFGIRSMSAIHRDEPFVFDFGGQRHEVLHSGRKRQRNVWRQQQLARPDLVPDELFVDPSDATAITVITVTISRSNARPAAAT